MAWQKKMSLKSDFRKTSERSPKIKMDSLFS